VSECVCIEYVVCVGELLACLLAACMCVLMLTLCLCPVRVSLGGIGGIDDVCGGGFSVLHANSSISVSAHLVLIVLIEMRDACCPSMRWWLEFDYSLLQHVLS
jgi:hypothetical protein